MFVIINITHITVIFHTTRIFVSWFKLKKYQTVGLPPLVSWRNYETKSGFNRDNLRWAENGYRALNVFNGQFLYQSIAVKSLTERLSSSINPSAWLFAWSHFKRTFSSRQALESLQIQLNAVCKTFRPCAKKKQRIMCCCFFSLVTSSGRVLQLVWGGRSVSQENFRAYYEKQYYHEVHLMIASL